MQLLPGPDGEDEYIDNKSNKPSHCNRVEAIHGRSYRIPHPITRHYDQAEGEENDPEPIFIRYKRWPQLHERRQGSCVFNANCINFINLSIYLSQPIALD